MSEGLLVSDSLITDILKTRIIEKDCEKGFILDGFPRTEVQAISLSALLEKLNKKIDLVIQINISEELLLKRTTGRQVCSNCLSVYNKFYNPFPKKGCNNCGGQKINTRKDDDIGVFKKRMLKYNNDTKPLVDFYKKINLIKSFEGNASSEEISNNIVKFIKNII